MTEQNKKLIALMEKTGIVDRSVLQEHLKKCYYESGNSPITDAEYDELFGNEDYVGYTPSTEGPWTVLPHKIAMGSLPKLKTWQDALQWLKDKNDVVWEPKLDGLSMELVYEQGYLTHAILRGGGTEGEDILKNAIKFNYVLRHLNPKVLTERQADYVSVRGEVVISQSNFNQLRQTTGADYSNRRNCVPGICRRYDGLYSDFLSFWSYDIIEQNESGCTMEYDDEIDKLSTLYNYGFKLPFANKTMTEEDYEKYADIRDTSEEFQMDGLVIKSLDMKHQIALKFEPNGERTTVTNYTWDVGSTGKLVPVIWFEQIEVGGTKLQKASGASLKNIETLNAPIGSLVEVRKMNDVIPKVTKCIKSSGNSLEVPTECPICGGKVERQGADLYCANPLCRVKMEAKCTAVYWPVAIKGIKDNWIRKLMEQGKIKMPSDVLQVTAQDLVNTGGFSIQRAEKVVTELTQKWKELVSNTMIEHFLWMLPIPTIAGKAYSVWSSKFNTWDELESWFKEWSIDRHRQLIEWLGNAKGNKAYDYITENLDGIILLVQSLRQL